MFTIVKMKDGNYDLHEGYVPVVGARIEMLTHTEIEKEDLCALQVAETKNELNAILSKYL